jgi:Vam6/Vps39-like protein vacuolar protein sorting-associated protein 39
MKVDGGESSDAGSTKRKQTDDGQLEGKDLVTATLALTAFLVEFN